MDERREGPPRATFIQTVKAVFSAFIGIRKSDHHRAVELSPLKVIVVGLICAALFVATLVTIVTLVIR